MSISPSGWISWAIVDEGPKNRQNYFGSHTSMTAIIHHSLEGVYQMGGYVSFRDVNRYPTLWHGTVKKDGRLYQHAPIFIKTVHAHNGNPLGPGFESEGFSNEPLTPAQVATFQQIHKEIEGFTGRKFDRVPGSKVGLVEHREVGATSCPSNRYAPLWESLKDTEMASNEYKQIMTLLFGPKYEERIKFLTENEIVSVEERVSRFKSSDGPIGVRLTDLEMESISHEAGLRTLELRHGIHIGEDE